MGPSGSGKTTLLNVLSSIDRVSEGAIFIEGNNVVAMKDRELAEFRKRHVGFIFQEYHLLDTLTVKENVLLPLSITKTPKREAEKKFAELAAELGITDIQNHYPSEISGGQKQRAAAARAFIHEPSIIFADEPTGALDSKAASDLLHKLQQLNKNGRRQSSWSPTIRSPPVSQAVSFLSKTDNCIRNCIKERKRGSNFSKPLCKRKACWAVFGHEHEATPVPQLETKHPTLLFVRVCLDVCFRLVFRVRDIAVRSIA